MTVTRARVSCEIERSGAGFLVTATVERDGEVISEVAVPQDNWRRALTCRARLLERWACSDFLAAQDERR